MLRRITRSSGLLALSCLGLALAAVPPVSGGASAGVRHAVTGQAEGSATPGIKPAFIYSQLDYLATRFQHREAGYRAGSAGHSAFARYRKQKMLRLLGRFGSQPHVYPFPATARFARPPPPPAPPLRRHLPPL